MKKSQQNMKMLLDSKSSMYAWLFSDMNNEMGLRD